MREPRGSGHGGNYIANLNLQKRPRKGDFAVVLDLKTGAVVPAIWAEVGPKSEAGEGSMRLARDVGINDDPKHGGESKRRFVYCLFPGTGNGRPRPLAEIQQLANDALKSWGGLERLTNVARQIP